MTTAAEIQEQNRKVYVITTLNQSALDAWAMKDYEKEDKDGNPLPKEIVEKNAKEFFDKLNELHSKSRIRTISVCTELETAQELVKGNYGDMYEVGYYPYAIIEETDCNGIYPHISKEDWFKWNKSLESYESIEKPEESNGTCNIGIG